jgi:glycosyltransferase involved in cell wall biosynthesis
LNTQSSPLKLREYLASGKPIVAVPLPEAKLLGDAVLTAEGGPGFVHAIEQALSTDTQELAAIRQKAVQSNTWDATVANILEKLEDALAKRE